MAAIDRIINGYKNAEDAAEYAEALTLDVEQNSGSDYTLVWTTAYSGDYPPEQ